LFDHDQAVDNCSHYFLEFIKDEKVNDL